MEKKIIRTYTILESVYKSFSEICEKKCINKSKFIANKILDFVNSEKRTDKIEQSENNKERG